MLGALMLFMLLPLAGCFGSDSHPDTSKGDTKTSSDSSNNSSHNDDAVNDNESGSESATNNSDSNGNDEGNNDAKDSTQSNEASQVPKTIKQARNATIAALNTEAAISLPNDFPLSEGKYLTAQTHSEQWYYRATFYEVNQPTKINASGATNGNELATVEGTEYDDASAARDSIKQYVEVTNTNTDLGHNIKAESDAGAGHSYIVWNEGNWAIKIDTPNDPIHKTDQFDTGTTLAKEIVSYLEENMLPAPKTRGVITIKAWKDQEETQIHWQNNAMTYQITSPLAPLKALQIAVSMKGI